MLKGGGCVRTYCYCSGCFTLISSCAGPVLCPFLSWVCCFVFTARDSTALDEEFYNDDDDWDDDEFDDVSVCRWFCSILSVSSGSTLEAVVPGALPWTSASGVELRGLFDGKSRPVGYARVRAQYHGLDEQR